MGIWCQVQVGQAEDTLKTRDNNHEHSKDTDKMNHPKSVGAKEIA